MQKLITLHCADVGEREGLLRQGLRPEDAAVLVGVSAMDTPFRVWKRLVDGEGGDEETAVRMMGKALEPMMLDGFRGKTGAVVRAPEDDLYVAYRSDAPYLRCVLGPYYWPEGTPDEQQDFHKAALILFKTVSGPARHREVPQAWFCEAQYRMAVTGAQRCTILCLSRTDGQMEWLSVDRNDGFCRTLQGKAEALWGMVESKTPPKATTEQDANQLYPEGETGAVAVADEATVAAAEELVTRLQENEKLLSKIDRLKTTIKNAMGKKETLIGPGGDIIATWKTVMTRSVDIDALQKENPQLMERFLTKSFSEKEFVEAAGTDPELAVYVHWVPYQRRLSVVGTKQSKQA